MRPTRPRDSPSAELRIVTDVTNKAFVAGFDCNYENTPRNISRKKTERKI